MMTSRLVTDDPQRVADWVALKVGQTASWGGYYALGVVRGDELLGGVVFNNWNGVNATAHIAVDRPGKHLIALLRAAFDYAFVQCGLKRLTGMVPASNSKVLAFDRHLGFEQECVIREAAGDGGDLNVLVMWSHRCRWIDR